MQVKETKVHFNKYKEKRKLKMFEKEKNLLTFTVATAKKPEGVNYQFDFNTANTINLSDNTKCKKRPAGVVSALKDIMQRNGYWSKEYDYANALLYIYNCWTYNNITKEELRMIANTIDKILALGKKIDFKGMSKENLAFINSNFKYLNDYPYDEICNYLFNEYMAEITSVSRGGVWVELEKNEIEVFFKYFRRWGWEKNIDKQNLLANIYVKSYIREFCENCAEALCIVQTYLEHCEELNHTPTHKNFMREYVEVNRSWNIAKAKIDNEKIAKNYEKHSRAWEFEYNGFTIVTPTCGKDLVTEGMRMHHCVGRYVDDIIAGHTYICFVRKTDNIDKPYITCEVCPQSGCIGQYYLAYDEHIKSKEDIEFKKAYQAYLNKIWELG